MTTLEPDRDQIEVFVNALFRYAPTQAPLGYISMRAFYDDGGNNVFRIMPAQITNGNLKFVLEVAEDEARRAANTPKPVVFCPPIAVFNNPKQAREDDLVLGLALSTECDTHAQEARAILEQLLGPATVTVASGGEWADAQTGELRKKLHIHYRLKQPAKTKEQISKLKLARNLATQLVGGDATNKAICHPIRWPGSWHRKGTPKLCEIETVLPDNEIDLDEALEKLKKAAKDLPPGRGDPQQEEAGKKGPLDWSTAFGKIISGNQFHPVLTPLSASFAAAGIPRIEARHILRALLDNTVTTDSGRLKRRDAELGKLADTVRSAYDKFAATPASGALFNPWEEFVVPAFPVDVLPGVVHDFVTAKSADIGVDVSGMAMSTLAACSGAINHQFRINLKHHGAWWMHPNLWVLLVGRSSWKKTPAIDYAVRPIYRAQAEIQSDYKTQLEDYQRRKKAKEDVEEPRPPVRYLVNDTTIEKLADLLSRTNRGILVVRDEIAGWVGGMDKYSSGGREKASSDRAFWLQSWNGGPYTYDRVIRGETFIPNLSTSFIGGIQPGRLAQLQGLTDDGLLQRFLPTLMQAPSAPADIDCRKIEENYNKLLRELITLPDQKLRVTGTAIDAMAELQQHLFKLEQVGGALPEGFEGFVGKLAGYAGSLTIILHLINEPAKAINNFVGGTVVKNVCRLVMNFLLPHAFQFYCLQTGETDRLRKLASFVLVSGLDRIRLADLTNKVWDCRGRSVVEINQRVSPLVAGGWLAPIELGPACRAWMVNRQAINEQFAARMTSERDNRAAFAQLLRARA
jgi:hypothetical protein